MMDEAQMIARGLKLPLAGVTATLELLDEGNTIPFIARYRKERTGSLDEEQLRAIAAEQSRLRSLADRRATIEKAIKEQEKWTAKLERALLAATTLSELEDIYAPYKRKRVTRASKAREAGLEPLAKVICEQPRGALSINDLVGPFLSDKVPTVEDAWAGARDIIAEWISDDIGIRQAVRQKAEKWAVLTSTKIKGSKDSQNVYKLYYDFALRVDRLRPHQILAINRGESEKVLRVGMEISERDWLSIVHQTYRPGRRSVLAEQLELAIEDSAKRLLLPAIERDVRSILTEQAEEQGIAVFASNLRGLLSQPPLAKQVVLGLDPAFRTGCKVAVIDTMGKVLLTDTVYPHQPQQKWKEAAGRLRELINEFGVTLIAIGNGTASRETEQLVAEITREMEGVHYIIVNEAGASVYSASPLAKQELPELDVSLRGAVSIARRAQDPLAELVKIDPKSLGVGLYQHDMNQKRLGTTLDGVVESVVNQVGVDVNTASPALLGYVAGLNRGVADKVVGYRDENGRFTSRQQLLDISGIGPKTYEQAAGFLRVYGGDEPLDASAIHPESYEVARAVLNKAGVADWEEVLGEERPLAPLRKKDALQALAEELDTGEPTLMDIMEQLVRPGRDPREDLPPPILRSDVLQMDDLTEGMRLMGTVRNVVDFGSFVDIGVKQDGLLHRSQIPDGAYMQVGDVIEVSILSVDKERGRIGLGWGG
ncbi:MAG TPA: Tex family protein [Anaerolineae bacterium]|nr:Tex family protein [Anaerolineae bacterium]